MWRFLTITLLLIFNSITVDASVVINEIMASNGNDIQDEDGDHSDWIELYNTGNEPYNLEGHYLTDDRESLEWQFPEYILEPGEHLIVFASNKDRKTGELHTNFAISKDGNFLALVTEFGSVLDQVEPVHIPRDKSYGRKPDGTDNWHFFNEPTPGKPNETTGYTEKLSKPEFSEQGGFYKEAFELTITHPDENVVIRYTLDGSKPDSSAPVYDGPIQIENRKNEPNKLSEIPSSHESLWVSPDDLINKSAVVRARAFKERALSSDVKTRTFFVEDEGADRYSFPVFSLSVNKDDLFDYENGIYVPGKIFDENYDADKSLGHIPANYNQRGRDWERPVHVELYDREGNQALAQDGGLRIHGSYSRSFPRKSLRLYARRDYGKFFYNYPLFEDKQELTRSKRFMLRNSGQDWKETLFRDAFIQSLFENMDFAVQGQTPSIVFINGEYWGIHNIRERIDQHFLAENKGVDPDEIDLLENRYRIKEGSNENYKEMLDFIEGNDLSEDANYEEVKNYMDIDNYIDFNIGHIYCNNYDWPGNNIDFWRPQVPGGKWRWIMFDTDFGFAHVQGSEASQFDMIKHATAVGEEDWPNPDWSTFLLRNLLKNENFRHQFINRYADLLNSEFQPERVIKRLLHYQELYKPELEEHINRWTYPENEGTWNWYISRMRDFAFERPYYARNHILKNFDLEDTYQVTVSADNSELGYIAINSLDIHDLNPNWTGTYFKGVPVTVTAVPYEGATFQGWEGDKNKEISKLTIDPGENISLTAIFEPDPDYEFPFTNPAAHDLSSEDFEFNEWSAEAEAGTFPQNMVFHQSFTQDPGLETKMTSDWTLPFNRTSRSRINGLNEMGISFINTSNPQHEVQAGYVGAAVVALNASDRKDIKVSWTGGTILPNERHYGIRLQYRTGKHEPFRDVKYEDGKPVEYVRNPLTSHEKRFEDISLPNNLNDKDYVQLRWKYYYIAGDSGPRGKLRLDNIHVTSSEIQISDPPAPTEKSLTVYPNPNRGFFHVELPQPLSSDGTMQVFNIQGQKVHEQPVSKDLMHLRNFDLKDINNGIYIIRITNSEQLFKGRIVIQDR